MRLLGRCRSASVWLQPPNPPPGAEPRTPDLTDAPQAPNAQTVPSPTGSFHEQFSEVAERQNERFFFSYVIGIIRRSQQSTISPVKKSDLIALAETMISSSFPALRGMALKVKIVDTEDYVMSVSLESEEIHLDVSREDVARMGRSAHGRGFLLMSFATPKRIVGTVRFSKLCSPGFTSAFRGWKPGWSGA